MKDDQFRCYACKGVFFFDRDNEEPIEAYKKEFPGKLLEEAETLCDNCYSAFKQWQESPEGKQACEEADRRYEASQHLIQSIVKVTGIPEDVLLGKK